MEVRSFFRSVVVCTTKRDWSTHRTPRAHAVVMPDESRPANECEGTRPWAHAATDRMVGHTTDRYTVLYRYSAPRSTEPPRVAVIHPRHTRATTRDGGDGARALDRGERESRRWW